MSAPARLRHAALALAVAGCAHRGPVAPLDPAAVPFNADLRAAELRTLSRTLEESYSHLRAKEAEWGFSLDALTARHERAIRDATTWKRYEQVMVSYVSAFHDTHLAWRRARGAGEPRRRIARLGLSSRFVGEALLVSEVWPGSAAERAGIAVGDEVLAIDGETVAQRLADFERVRSMSRREAARHDFGADWPAARYDAAAAPAARRLTLVRGGQTRELEVAPETAPPPGRRRPATIAIEQHKDATVLRLRSLQEVIPPASLDQLAAALLPEQSGVAGLVIDLRDNAGGYENQARALVGRLTAHPVVGARLRVRLGPRSRSEHGAWQALVADPAMPGWSSLQDVTAAPHAARDFPARIAVVIDAGCRSSCETLALLLRALGARLFGATTGGSSGAPIAFTMPWSKAQVTIPVWELFDLDGHPVEGRGVAPDEPVEPTAADLIEGRDRPLELAVEWASTRFAALSTEDEGATSRPSN